MKNVPVLSGLLGWFAGRDENRRRYPRVKKSFRAAYTLDSNTWQPALGVDMSGGGMCVLTQQEVGQPSFHLRMTLETRLINLRVRPVWNTKVNHNGKAVQCYGLQFISVGVEDWDAIMQWVTGKAPEPNETAAEAQAPGAVMKREDVERLIPPAFQARLLGELVKRKRLAPVDPKSPPLVQYEYGGVTHLQGKPMHKLTIQSKVGSGKEESRFSTRFMFDDTGKNLVILN